MLGRHPRRTPAAVLLALLLVLGTGAACSTGGGTDADSPAGDPTSAGAPSRPAAEPAAPVVPTRLRTGWVTGTLEKERRKQVVADVGRIVDGWLEAAYVGGDYPRTAFGRSFPGFTAVATRTARGDRDLMSNADLGDRIDGLTVKRRAVTVDLLAVGGRARAATARVDLGFTTHGTVRRVRVTGRVFLTRRDGRWRIFGYDVAKAAA